MRHACFYYLRYPPEGLNGGRVRWQHETGRLDGGRGSVMGNKRRVRGRRRTGMECLAE